MLKLPFVLRSKYERLERESQWIAGQFVTVRQEAERLYNELENTKENNRFANVMFEHYKKHYEVLHKKVTNPRAANGRFVQITEVK